MKKITFTEETKEKLKEVIGEKLTYAELCKKTGLPPKKGNSKKAQLNELTSYCEIVKLNRPTRYVVKEVFEVAFEVIAFISGNNKFQTIFDGVLFQALLDKKGYPLYASGLDLIEMFQEVNKNFSFTFSEENLKKIGGNYNYMKNMGEVVYRILHKWTQRKIESMSDRGVIRLGVGYRVYSKVKSYDGKTYYKKYDVPVSTSESLNELDRLCDEIYLRTKQEILPTKRKIDKNTGEVKLNNFYPEYKLAEFESVLNKRISEATSNKFCKLKRVNVILPPYDEWMINKLKEIYAKIPNFEEINKEACKKVLETTQLDGYTNKERKEFILFNMSNNPPFLFRDKLKEKEKLSN